MSKVQLRIRVMLSVDYTNEYTGDYIELVYLRARYYAPGMGRFLTKDTWRGDYSRPLSLNPWIYGYGNPVKYTDPSGLCPTCYVFLFPGAGNLGDADGNNDLEDNLGRESNLVRELRGRIPGITVEVVYPYRAGIRTTWDPVIGKPILGIQHPLADPNGNLRSISSTAYGLSSVPRTKADEIEDYYSRCFADDEYNVTFIGFSGGGQMAYSTAQSLTSRIFVDNLVLLGGAFRAHSGIGNIGHIWDLVGINDTDYTGKGGEKLLGWDSYNRGYRQASHYMAGTVYIRDSARDIYQNGATRCTLYGLQHIHYGDGDYFEDRTSVTYGEGMTLDLPFNGASCSGGGTGSYMHGNDRSRLDFLVNFLIQSVGVGRQK